MYASGCMYVCGNHKEFSVEALLLFSLDRVALVFFFLTQISSVRKTAGAPHTNTHTHMHAHIGCLTFKLAASDWHFSYDTACIQFFMCGCVCVCAFDVFIA